MTGGSWVPLKTSVVSRVTRHQPPGSHTVSTDTAVTDEPWESMVDPSPTQTTKVWTRVSGDRREPSSWGPDGPLSETAVETKTIRREGGGRGASEEKHQQTGPTKRED